MKGRGFQVRLLLLTLLVVAAGGTVTVRLVDLQVQRSDAYQRRALRQQQHIHKLQPRRGEILDRSGHELALSVPAEAIAARPSVIGDPAAVARTLAPLLGRPVREIASRLRSTSRYVYLSRKATPEQRRAVRRAIRDRGIRGIEFEAWSRRIYPNRELAAHALGFVGVDDAPLGGVETAFNDAIKGTPGKAVDLKDAKGAAFRRQVLSPSIPGNSLQLTLDLTVQHIIEEELDHAVRQARARAGAAVALDPSTGEVLAIASWPTFNPNEFSRFSPEDRRDRAVVSAYEPGSTFKVVTAATALENGVIHRNEVLHCGNGVYTIGRHRIRDHKRFADLTFTQVVARSSNVGAIKAGMRLQAGTFYDAIVDFGFGERTGVGLPAENPGLLRHPDRWSLLSQPGLSMGQEILVTPLQVISAIGAVANDGVLVRPWLARALFDPEGRVLESFESPEPRRVISERTARTLTDMLVTTVEEGTATGAAVPGYLVAGKTGTAQKSAPDGSGYIEGKYVASFAGYVPAHRPRLAAIFVIDEPGTRLYHGGDVAAPAFGRFAARALPALGIAPDPDLDRGPGVDRVLIRPDAAGASASTRWVTLKRPASRPAFQVDDPLSGRRAGWRQARLTAEAGRMPGVIGLSARDAVARLTSIGMTPRLTGQGRVKRQVPAAGSKLAGAAEGVQLWLERP